ncbi:chromosome segregation protein SMC [Paracoccus contaminans]|uniref:Chromosome partition protein Smc n=1 Tax=Paracoccus contaminans TaxID=1945662 RepID=A0A1W6CXE8_9RHOB|nr:chromosome segregation protein SMC [Paracoccus contaminans]ARJ69534.1 chromosome segregation protein SMC [Paracoccus contaminans]
MRFDRLRLNGFKSFVDPAELVIREGLTGIVGPNGCGKSNLLEAIRWVMGESRPTAMRGAGMEDVIFAGTTRRPARAHAEVTLAVDNRRRLAPAGFNDADRLDITRRITRDGGSVYRINGREVRARDVQMLFADASSGAQSPALVRQGQIAELINARPAARRRILEEAAGIGGLYQRRHEAELKLSGAAANLARVDDRLEQLGAQAAALTRQARSAARYREIGAALRAAERAALWRRWSDAAAALEEASDALAAARSAALRSQVGAQRAAGLRAAAEAALPPLRDEEAIAAALAARAAAEAEALDEAGAQASAAIDALSARLAELDRDIARETALNRDAAEAAARLGHERAELERAQAGHEDRLAAAETGAEEAGAALRAIEARLGDAADEAARLAARHQSADRLASDLRAMGARAEGARNEAGRAADGADAASAAARAALAEAGAAQGRAQAAAAEAEARLAAAEASRTSAAAAETAARTARAAAQGEAGALEAERAALERLVQRRRAGGGALLDALSVAPGHERALGAALGDDLRLPVRDGGAGTRAGWRLLPPLEKAAPLPQGVTTLADHVAAPPALARRLAQTGLAADAAAASALQPALRPGQRLVTPAGDLVRWDGLVVPADQAASAAALHLQQVNRLAGLGAEAQAAQARADAAAAAHETARAALDIAAAAETAARGHSRAAERALAEAVRRAAGAETALSLATARAEAARADLTRHAADAADAAKRLAEADEARAALPDLAAAAAAVDSARRGAEAARAATLTRRGALDELRREGAARARRLHEIAREDEGWRARLDQADGRAAELARRRDEAAAALAEAEARPAILSARRADLGLRAAAAGARLDSARAALADAGAALSSAQAGERDAERAAADARAAHAACEARAEAAGHAEAQAASRIREATGETPQALARQLEDGAALPPAARIEGEIARLRAARDALGAVNLRAEEDKRALEDERARLAAEKADLDAAIHRLRAAIGNLNREGRERLLAAFEQVNTDFGALFTHLFGGGEARLVLVESDDPLEAGLDILAQPPGKKLSTLSLLSGGEQTLTALALILAVFLGTPAPICVLDEVDAPLDDANVARFCDLLEEMRRRTDTRFLVITHHGVTMARMDRLFGVTMAEQGVSQLVSVDLERAGALVA